MSAPLNVIGFSFSSKKKVPIPSPSESCKQGKFATVRLGTPIARSTAHRVSQRNGPPLHDVGHHRIPHHNAVRRSRPGVARCAQFGSVDGNVGMGGRLDIS